MPEFRNSGMASASTARTLTRRLPCTSSRAAREARTRALLERDYHDPGHAAEVGDIGRQQ